MPDTPSDVHQGLIELLKLVNEEIESLETAEVVNLHVKKEMATARSCGD